MKQPGPMTHVLGNPVAFAVIAGTTGLLIYLWLSDQVAWPLAFIACAVAFKASKAYREVQAFNAWQREWNAMAGMPEPQKTSLRKKPWALTLWTCLLILVVSQPFADPAYNTVAELACATVSIWIVGKYLWKAARWLSRSRVRAVADAESHHVVEVCLPVPRNTCSVRHITSVLPGYCQQLLRHGAKESS